MITVLMHDVRNGMVNPQLAELYIPIRIAHTPLGNFWADAKDLISELQSGPSRIDGNFNISSPTAVDSFKVQDLLKCIHFVRDIVNISFVFQPITLMVIKARTFG
ncbi:hypothetical protein AX15_000008 [Amanita polypyramis BW_CC]|nr:hypothetical protein AX15_000008 [Amanita polypyramis BW_CC]